MSTQRECVLCGTPIKCVNDNGDEAALCGDCVQAVRVYRKRAKMGLCPFCESLVRVADFRDGLSLREFMISGLCQKCQDETF